MDVNIEDPASLIAWLQAQGRLQPGEIPIIQRLDGGVSNRTVLLQRSSGERWVLKQALARLRVATLWESDPARIHREALALRELGRLFPDGPFPQFVFEDATQHILAMTAIPEPHKNWKLKLLAGRIDLALVEQFARVLAQLHRASHRCLPALPEAFQDQSYFESLRLDPYYRYAAQQNPGAAPFLESLIQETRRHRIALVHGDFSPKNTLAAAGRLYLLDFEVMHCGDPAFDVGFALTHFLAKANHLPACRDSFAGAADFFWNRYRQLGGFDEPDFEERAARHTLACLIARVDGRSPLEYLAPDSRNRQRAAALTLLHPSPARLSGMIHSFVQHLSS